MARDITAGFKNKITADQLRPAIFFKFQFESGDLNLWTGQKNFTLNDDVYVGAGGLIALDRIEETQELRATALNISLSGIPSAYISLALASNYQGRIVTAWFVVLNDDNSAVADPYEIFRGRMDIISFSDNGETSDYIIKCESNAIDIRKVKNRRFTDEDQKILYPNDKGLEFISKIQDIDIVWG